MRVSGKLTTARRVAWELAHGPLAPDVVPCPDDAACVRSDHLSVAGADHHATPARRRAARGGGSKVQIRPGVWKLRVTTGRFADGTVRRAHKTVHAPTAAEASQAPAAFVAEVHESPPAESKADRDRTMNDAIEQS